MSSTLGIHMEEELRSQPDTWRTALKLDSSALPKKGERVCVVGCGTSWFMAQSYASLREQSGEGITDAFTPTEFSAEREYDTAIVITRSGTTSEIINFLKENAGKLHTVALLGDVNTPVADLADDVIDLSFADEKSVVQTRFATTALMVLRSTVANEETCLKACDEAAEALCASLDDRLIDAEQYSFLGRGWVQGLATEAALKMRESCQAWTESYNSMEYRHGPIAIAAPGRITWQLGSSPDGLEDQVNETGATYVEGSADPMVELVKVHMVALATARARGLDPDHPRNLSRSVILK